MLDKQNPVEAYDIIFGDAFHDISIPQHLVTYEFNELIKSRLKKNGFYIVNVVDNASRPVFLLSFVKTLDLTFRNIQVWFEPNITSTHGRVTYTIVASQKRLYQDIITAKNGFDRTWWLWPAEKLRNNHLYKKLPILTDDRAPVDLLMSNNVLRRQQN